MWLVSPCVKIDSLVVTDAIEKDPWISWDNKGINDWKRQIMYKKWKSHSAIVGFYLILGCEDESERNSTFGSSVLGSHESDISFYEELMLGLWRRIQLKEKLCSSLYILGCWLSRWNVW